MAVELKDVLKLLSIETDNPDELTLDEIKNTLQQKFISRDAAVDDDELHKKIMGKANGILRTKMAKLFDLKHKELEELSPAEALEIISEKINNKLKEYETRLGELQKNNKAPELEKLKAERDAYLEQINNLKTEYETFKQEAENKLKETKLNYDLTNIKSRIKFVDNVTPEQQEFFDWKLKNKYIFDYDENGQLIVRDKEGKPIPNPDKVGEFARPEDIIVKTAKELNLLKMNNTQPDNKKTNIKIDDNGVKFNPVYLRNKERFAHPKSE